MNEAGEQPRHQLAIGIVCYASLGGSGVVAADLATGLAGRGHRVHVVASATAEPPAAGERPARLPPGIGARVPALRAPAVRAGAGGGDRRSGRRAAPRCRPRALRRAARGQCLPRAPGAWRSGAAHRDDAARHRRDRCGRAPQLSVDDPLHGGRIGCAHRSVGVSARRRACGCSPTTARRRSR